MKKKIISLFMVAALAVSILTVDTASYAATKAPGKTTVKTTAPKKTAIKIPKKKPVKKPVKTSTIVSNVKKAYGDDYIPSVKLTKTEIEESFGIKESWYTDITAETSMISFHCDTFVAVKAKKGNVDDVVDALNDYRDYLVNESFQYPMNMPKVNASQVLKVDDYVFFIMLGVIPDDIEPTEEASLKAAKDQNEIAVKSIKKSLGKK